jgi:hypothetical protein
LHECTDCTVLLLLLLLSSLFPGSASGFFLSYAARAANNFASIFAPPLPSPPRCFGKSAKTERHRSLRRWLLSPLFLLPLLLLLRRGGTYSGGEEGRTVFLPSPPIDS